MAYSYTAKKIIQKKLKEVLRKHRFMSLYDGGKYKLNPANIDPKIYTSIKELSRRYDIIIGGSTVLKFYNLIDRKIKDIDIIVSSEILEIISHDFEVSESDDNYSCSKFIFNGITVDIFVDDEEKDYIDKYDMKLDTLQSIINAKLAYGREKDYKDFEYIIKCIDPSYNTLKTLSIFISPYTGQTTSRIRF